MGTRTILVEDEVHARDRLRKLLADFPGIQIVGEAGDGASAVEMIDDLRPDLAFLDIELPELSGIEVLSRIRHRPRIIFVTAYDQYAVRAFEENALDYILKPTTRERLASSLERLDEPSLASDPELLERLGAALQRRSYTRQLAVRQRDSILLVSVEQLLWLQAQDRYVILRTAEQEYVSDHTLKVLEEELDPERFIRIHRGVIVARDRIARIDRSFGGRYSVRLDDNEGTRFDIGRSYLERVREVLGF